MKPINNVSIALKPNVYRTFRNLVNTVSNTLSEYVDNALQSYLTNKKELLSAENNYKLNVNININWERRSIIITDNAAGINQDNYIKAFEPAHIPNDASGLNEFGMGMKTASVWLADKWSVKTKALGENVSRYTEFDLIKVTVEEKENLIVTEEKALENEHYTIIELSELSTNAPRPGQMDKIKKHLSSIYRHFLRTGEIIISVNGTNLEAPNYSVLRAPFYKNPEGQEILWRKEIDIKINNYSAKGFIAILDKIQAGVNGLVLTRRGRVVMGGGDERFFPSVIFTQPGNFRYKRLFGELELEGFEVTFNKNGFREENELEILMEAIRDELRADKTIQLLTQADNYRQRNKEQTAKISKEIIKNLIKENNCSFMPQIIEIKDKISENQILKKEEEILKKANTLDSLQENFKYGDLDYILKLELVDEPDAQILYSVHLDPKPENSVINQKSIICKINLAHPFFTRFEQFKKSNDYSPIIEIFKSFAIAEILAQTKGTRQGSMIRFLFNKNIIL